MAWKLPEILGMTRRLNRNMTTGSGEKNGLLTRAGTTNTMNKTGPHSPGRADRSGVRMHGKATDKGAMTGQKPSYLNKKQL